MLILVTLNRMVWEDAGCQVLRPLAADMVTMLRKLEGDLGTRCRGAHANAAPGIAGLAEGMRDKCPDKIGVIHPLQRLWRVRTQALAGAGPRQGACWRRSNTRRKRQRRSDSGGTAPSALTDGGTGQLSGQSHGPGAAYDPGYAQLLSMSGFDLRALRRVL